MQQTPIEFLTEGLFNILQDAENNNIFEVGTQNFKRYIEMFSKEAKEREDKRIIQAIRLGAGSLGEWTPELEKSILEEYKNFKSE
jgi:hypothetical protein